MRFSLELFETSLFTIQDVASSIGGIIATINASAALLLMVTIGTYMISLGQMIQRKAKYKLWKIMLKRMQEEMPCMIKVITKKYEESQNQVNQG